MVMSLEGLFTDPNEIRQKRIEGLANQLEARKDMSLLNQVAAGRGAQLAEATAGMFGLQTPEEARNAEIKDMVGQLNNLRDPEGLSVLAKHLNDNGYTTEAVKVLNLRTQVMADQNAERDRTIEQAMRDGKLRKIQPTYVWEPRTDSKGQPILGPDGLPVLQRKEVPQYERWNERLMRWEKVSSGTAGVSGISVVDPTTGVLTMKEGDPTSDTSTETVGFPDDIQEAR